MAGKCCIAGTARKIVGGKALVAGTVRKITGGKVMAGGTGYEIKLGAENAPASVEIWFDNYAPDSAGEIRIDFSSGPSYIVSSSGFYETITGVFVGDIITISAVPEPGWFLGIYQNNSSGVESVSSTGVEEIYEITSESASLTLEAQGWPM